MFVSAVTSGQSLILAVATIRRSAGSLWNSSGKLTASIAIAGVIGIKITP
jgi:hypothetical protein